MKGVLAAAILFFISQQAVSQTNSFNKNKALDSLSDSAIKRLYKQLKIDPLVSNRGNMSSENRLRGYYNLMPMMKPDSNFKDIMPHYSPPPGVYFNMPVVPFIYENEKQNSAQIKTKNKKVF